MGNLCRSRRRSAQVARNRALEGKEQSLVNGLSVKKEEPSERNSDGELCKG